MLRSPRPRSIASDLSKSDASKVAVPDQGMVAGAVQWWRRSWKGAIAVVIAVALGWLSFGHAPAHALTDDQKLYNEAWRAISRAYLDDSFNGQNWWMLREKALKKPFRDREATYDAIRDLLGTLGDPFTRFMTPEQYRSLRTNTAGALTGVGLQIGLDGESGQLVVVAPLAGSPAEAAGFVPRDVIEAIDGVPTKDLTLDEAAARMRGTVGTQVLLAVRHQDGQQENVTVTRARVEINPVTYELRQSDSGLKVGYIRLTQFNSNATEDMELAIEDLEDQGAQAYVLDLRNNPGGLLQAGVEIARLWIDEGAIVYTVNRQGIFDGFNATDSAMTDAPLAVLVNRGTASASEILAGALQDSGRAVLVGDRTFGKGLIQSLFDLSDGSGVAVTVAKYETPSHRDINQLGIEPDERVEAIALAQNSGRDLGKAQALSKAAVQDISGDPVYEAALKRLERQG